MDSISIAPNDTGIKLGRGLPSEERPQEVAGIRLQWLSTGTIAQMYVDGKRVGYVATKFDGWKACPSRSRHSATVEEAVEVFAAKLKRNKGGE